MCWKWFQILYCNYLLRNYHLVELWYSIKIHHCHKSPLKYPVTNYTCARPDLIFFVYFNQNNVWQQVQHSRSKTPAGIKHIYKCVKQCYSSPKCFWKIAIFHKLFSLNVIHLSLLFWMNQYINLNEYLKIFCPSPIIQWVSTLQYIGIPNLLGYSAFKCKGVLRSKHLRSLI